MFEVLVARGKHPEGEVSVYALRGGRYKIITVPADGRAPTTVIVSSPESALAGMIMLDRSDVVFIEASPHEVWNN